MVKRHNIFSDKRISIVLHIIAWTIILIIPVYLMSISGEEDRPFPYHIYVSLAIYGLLFYTNYLWLVPELFFKKRRSAYFLSAIMALLIACASMIYVNDHILIKKEHEKEMPAPREMVYKGKQPPEPPMMGFRFISYLSTSVLILGFSLGLKLLEKVSQDEKERKELEKEKLNSELAFLKNQISPHFFFNTLNNIYALISSNSSTAQESVLKLSKLMRYLLYESEKGSSKLSQEIEFLKNYIDLMKLRLNDKVDLSFSFPSNYPDLIIPPLLFIPFIENAFKHGISYRTPSYIEIKMAVSETTIHFMVRNSKTNNAPVEDRHHYGIGLENVKKRLSLLYPHKHRLFITENEGDYMVELTLEIGSDNEKN